MSKKSLMLMALLAMSMLLLPARADVGGAPVYCGDLSAADCQLLQDNAELMDALSALSFAGSMSLNAKLEEPMALAGQGSGQIAFDADAVETLAGMSAESLAANSSAALELLLTSIKADVAFKLSGNIGEEAIELEMSLLLKDGVLLLGVGAMEALMGESMTGMPAFGIDLNDGVAELLGGSAEMSMPEHSEKSPMESSAATIARLADSAVNGKTVAVYETNIDVEALFAQLSGEDIAAASSELDDAQAVEAMMEAVTVSVLSMRQYIGIDEAYTQRLELAMHVDIGGDAFAMEGSGSLAMTMDVILSGFNQPLDIELPDETMVFPLAMLTQMAEQ